VCAVFRKLGFYLWILGITSLGLLPQKAAAYPSFISYGYATCITCHYNGQGNGPLNDYGRGLFTSEVAARGWVDPKLSDEQLAERSGFLGARPMPWWFRPGAKYRGLYFVNNPGATSQVQKYITMQADLNAAFHLDQDAKKVIVVSAGYSPTPASQQGRKEDTDKNMISREHYLRWQNSKKLFTYYGLMDKVYGLRIADHTAYSRASTGVSMNDQTHGVMAQYYGEGVEMTGHLFVGNLLQETSDVRQTGASFMYEKDLAEKNRLGAAILYSTGTYVQKTRMEVHSKLGLLKGNSLLSEIGFIKDTPATGAAKNMGGYAIIEGNYFIRRGYNLISQLEYYNATLGPESPDLMRWTFGLLAFPMDRLEWRMTFVNGRSISDTAVATDQWMLQTQLHLSL
jgi:hypothetical protein